MRVRVFVCVRLSVCVCACKYVWAIVSLSYLLVGRGVVGLTLTGA